MVDRGPDPLGVVRIVRSLPNTHVLMGNHEAMLLETILTGDESDMMAWHMNGGFVTSEQLDALARDAYVDVMDWFAALPTFAVVEVDDARRSVAPGARRSHVLCHAGIDASRLRESLAAMGVAADTQGAMAEPRHATYSMLWFNNGLTTFCGYAVSSGRNPRDWSVATDGPRGHCRTHALGAFGSIRDAHVR